MAIVPDLSGGVPADLNRNGRATDRVLSTVNRNVSANPIGVTTPGYTGEMVLDTSTGQLWEAGNLTNTGWLPITKVV